LSARENRTCVYDCWEEEVSWTENGMTWTNMKYHWRRNADATGYRLPDHFEWGYACRAGTTTKWSHGNDDSIIDRYVHYFRVSHLPGPAPVGLKMPNAWGLFDMCGNADEICWPPSYVNRGGSWADYPGEIRGNLARGYTMGFPDFLQKPDKGVGTHGFRIVLNSP
jgi:hypothetical protein